MDQFIYFINNINLNDITRNFIIIILVIFVLSLVLKLIGKTVKFIFVSTIIVIIVYFLIEIIVSLS